MPEIGSPTMPCSTAFQPVCMRYKLLEIERPVQSALRSFGVLTASRVRVIRSPWQGEMAGESMVRVWTWPHHCGHIWELVAPHLSSRPLDLQGLRKGRFYTSLRNFLVQCIDFQTLVGVKKVWRLRFPNVSTFMVHPQASIMAPATPFCFWTTQKHLTR